MITERQGVDLPLSPEVMTEGMPNSPTPAISSSTPQPLRSGGARHGQRLRRFNLSQAQIADEILLVTTNEFTAPEAVQRALSYLDSNNIGRYKVRLIVNRYNRHTGLSKMSSVPARGYLPYPDHRL